VPLIHDLLTNIADGIVVCTGSKAGNGNIVDRAALGALKFIYGTLPRLIRHHANMRLRRTHARLNTVQWVCSLAAITRGQKSSEGCCRIVSWNSRSFDTAKAARGNPPATLLALCVNRLLQGTPRTRNLGGVYGRIPFLEASQPHTVHLPSRFRMVIPSDIGFGNRRHRAVDLNGKASWKRGAFSFLVKLRHYRSARRRARKTFVGRYKKTFATLSAQSGLFQNFNGRRSTGRRDKDATQSSRFVR
jgi:hypothetical protein